MDFCSLCRGLSSDSTQNATSGGVSCGWLWAFGAGVFSDAHPLCALGYRDSASLIHGRSQATGSDSRQKRSPWGGWISYPDCGAHLGIIFRSGITEADWWPAVGSGIIVLEYRSGRQGAGGQRRNPDLPGADCDGGFDPSGSGRAGTFGFGWWRNALTLGASSFRLSFLCPTRPALF